MDHIAQTRRAKFTFVCFQSCRLKATIVQGTFAGNSITQIMKIEISKEGTIMAVDAFSFGPKQMEAFELCIV